jgi:endogenous inhibitor of DNA gyrase (YacG/DUF329 family)
MAKKYCRRCGREITGQKTFKKVFCSRRCYEIALKGNKDFWGKKSIEGEK